MGSASPLIVVTGTGTNVGKTHVATALLRAWGTTRAVLGYKPVETGAGSSSMGEDARSLAGASTFHVKRPAFAYVLAPPISPHLAARHAGVVLDLAKLERQVSELRAEAAGVVVELAGGLFTPLTREAVNLDLARALDATALLLVAPDRIGVLHDVGATLRAARASALHLHGVVLSAPAVPDASTGTNTSEIHDINGISVLATFPRSSVDEERTLAAARSVLDALGLGEGREP
jgi:dethiobiotin synthetase